MVVTFLMMLVVAVCAAIFRAEWEAWMPWIAERLRRLALRPLSGTLRDRFDEEWSSYLDEMPGYVGKVWSAVGFNWASRRIAARAFRYRLARRIIRWGMRRALTISSGTLTLSHLIGEQRIVGCQQIGALLSATGLKLFVYAFKAHYWRILLIEDRDRRTVMEEAYANSLKAFAGALTGAASAAENGDTEYSATVKLVDFD